MEERGRNGMILSMESTTPALITDVTLISNHSDIYPEYCVSLTEIFWWLNVIIDVIGLAGNSTVIWLLGFQIQRNAILVYILNLAVADFLYLCFHLIFSLQKITIHFLETRIYLSEISYFALVYFYTIGLSFLSVISLERCLSVLCPIWYRCRRPRHASSFMCTLVWVLSLPFNFLLTYYCEIQYAYDNWKWCLSLTFSIVVYLLFLFMILSGASLALTVRMFCGSRRISLTRLYVTVLLTVLVFVLCGLPFGINHFLRKLFYIEVQFFLCYFSWLFIFLSCVNSGANPIIYFFVGSFRQRQRQTLKQVLQRALQDTPKDNECGSYFSRVPPLEMAGSRVEQL